MSVRDKKSRLRRRVRDAGRGLWNVARDPEFRATLLVLTAPIAVVAVARSLTAASFAVATRNLRLAAEASERVGEP